ncbi:MAG: hypothetical protein MJZ74_01815 [Muribaculaceae bacterium]|nr:hypothetical protein [Muribaculaceae bacterium]
MKKFYSFMAMSLLALAAWAGEVTFDFSSADGLKAAGIQAPEASAGTNLAGSTFTVGGVALTATDGATPTRVWNSQGTYTLRVYVNGSVTFSVASGSITGVTINAASEGNFELKANVGTYKANGTVGTWTGSASSVSFSKTGSKNAQIANVVITTSTEDPGTGGGTTGGGTTDPTKFQLDSLSKIWDVPVGTEFQFTTECYVNYQNGKYLYVQQLDDEYYAWAGLIYGDTDKQYEPGDVIPAGWTAKMADYKGLIEFTDPAGLQNAVKTVDPDWYTPFDMTGYLDDIMNPEYAYENFKVYAEGVQLTAADDKGNFSIIGAGSEGEDVTLAGFNKFGVELPASPAGLYSVEGMVAVYNGTYQLYPIEVKPYEYTTKLWKVCYYGEEDGTELTLNDSLYVAASVCDEVTGKKLVYVTDNATSILYDEFADWGYTWYEDWYPDWIALDLTGNDELFEKIDDMDVIAPMTVRGTITGALFDPVLKVTSTPEELQVADPEEILFYSYDLTSNDVYPAANEMAVFNGVYQNGFLTGGEENDVKIKVDTRYSPEGVEKLVDGATVVMISVAKMKEPWEVNDYSAPAKAKAAKAAPSKCKAPVATVAPAAMGIKKIAAKADPYADNYYENYTLLPIVIESHFVGVNDLTVKAAKTYKTIENGQVIIVKGNNRYNVMGQPVK